MSRVSSPGGETPPKQPRSAFRRIAGTAFPLYVTMIAASIGAALNVGLVGRHATASLAAFAVTIAVYAPATATVAGVRINPNSIVNQ